MTGEGDIARAMARLRKALEARMRADAKRDQRRERAASRKRKAEGGLVSYDTRGLGLVLRPALEWDGRGWRAIAAEIGVTSPDLSRVMAGQDISAAKVFAICDWLKVNPRKFYRPLRGKRPRFRGLSPASRAAPRAKRAGPPAGRATAPGVQSDAAASPECFTGEALKQRGGRSPQTGAPAKRRGVPEELKGGARMTDTMIPIVRQMLDAGDDRARAAVLLQVSDSVLMKYRPQFEAACRRAGFEAGQGFIDCRRAAFHARRGVDGVLRHEPFELMRSALAELASDRPMARAALSASYREGLPAEGPAPGQAPRVVARPARSEPRSGDSARAK